MGLRRLIRRLSRNTDDAAARRRQRGQGVVELTMVLPIILLVVVGAAEFGLAFDDLLTVGYGSREGARVGAALAKGNVKDCGGGADLRAWTARHRIRPADTQITRVRCRRRRRPRDRGFSRRRPPAARRPGP